MTDKYILDNTGRPVPEPDLMKWAAWFESSREKRIVARDDITVSGVEVRVSTVFLGMDHQWGDGPPLLWETMIFGGPLTEEQDRCSGSREQAEAMHAAMLARAKAAS